MNWKRARQAGSEIIKKGKDAALEVTAQASPQEIVPDQQAPRQASFDPSLFPRLTLIWNYCLLSLPLDIVIYASGLGPPSLRQSSMSSEMILLILSCLVLISLFRRDILLGAIFVQFIRNKFLFRSSKIVFFLLLAVVLLVTFLDAYLRHQGKGLSAFIIPAIAVLAAIIPAWKALKERLHRLQRKARNRLIWVEELDRQHFLFMALSLAPARLISVASACTLQEPAFFLAVWISSLFLLFHLEPKEGDFLILCRRCLKKTSRSLAGMRYCPDCSRIKFYSPEEISAKLMEKSR